MLLLSISIAAILIIATVIWDVENDVRALNELERYKASTDPKNYKKDVPEFPFDY